MVGEEGFDPSRGVTPADFKFLTPAHHVTSGHLAKLPCYALRGANTKGQQC